MTQCDTATSDTWWTGARLGEHARRWTALLTDGEGIYCTTQEEDNATLTALTRGAQSGLIDFKRVAVLRSGSDFDRGYMNQSAFDALRAQFALAGAVRISTDNLVRAGCRWSTTSLSTGMCGAMGCRRPNRPEAARSLHHLRRARPKLRGNGARPAPCRT